MSLEPSLSEQVEEWERLKALPAWKWFCEQVKEQRETRVNSVIRTPLVSFDAALEQEYTKGEMATLEMVQLLPELAIEQLKVSIAEILNEKEQENE